MAIAREINLMIDIYNVKKYYTDLILIDEWKIHIHNSNYRVYKTELMSFIICSVVSISNKKDINFYPMIYVKT
jgi:hypothetical protein